MAYQRRPGSTYDATVVHKTGTETIAGAKSFSDALEVYSGAASPVALTAQQRLRVTGADGTFVNALIESYGGTASMIGRRANGTKALPTGPLNNEIVFQFLATGYVNGAFQGTRSAVNFCAAEDWWPSAQGMYITVRTTSVGSTSNAERVRFGPDGTITLVNNTVTAFTADGGGVDLTRTAAQIAAVGNAINTVDKMIGKRVWDTTNHRPMWASGSAAADPWYDATGLITVTPA